MEKIKKIIKQSVILKKDNDNINIAPNMNTYYNIKFLLKKNGLNMGLFDYYTEKNK